MRGSLNEWRWFFAGLTVAGIPAAADGLGASPDHVWAACEAHDLLPDRADCDDPCYGITLDTLHCEGVHGAGDGATILGEYTDPNTGNVAKLFVREDAIFCGWEASVNTHTDAGFVPSQFFVQCYINNINSPNTRLGKNSENAGAVGEMQLLGWIPKATIQWSVRVYAMDIRVEDTTTHVETTATVTRHEVHGDMGAEMHADVDVQLKWPPVSLNFGTKLQGSAGFEYEQTTKTEEVTTEEHKVYQQHALFLGVQDLVVNLVPTIKRLEWTSGKSWGCDALDIIEESLGERELDDYSAYLQTSGAPDGGLDLRFDASEPRDILDEDDFNRAIMQDNGVEADYWDQLGFESTLSVLVNYEYPESFLRLDNLMFSQDGQEHSVGLELVGSEAGIQATVTNTTLPPEDIQQPVVFVPMGEIGLHYGGLPGALAAAIVWGDVDAPTLTNNQCDAANLLESPDKQTWTAVAQLEGFSTGTTTARDFAVDVYLDLVYGGCTEPKCQD